MEWLNDISRTPFFPLVAGIVLIVVAIFCAAYGKRKGYSTWGCFFICIFGTLVGIIVVVLLPDIVKREEQIAASFRYRDKEIEDLKKCNKELREMIQSEGKQ